MPTVSVVIPTHNRRELVLQAVASVLQQTYRDFEVIVVDDGSIDGTAEALTAAFGDRIIVIRLESTLERSAARNAGWEAARSPLIAFLDSDDLWLRDKLARQVPLFDDPAVGLVHGFVAIMNEAGQDLPGQTAIQMRFYRDALRRGYTYEGMAERCVMYTSTTVIRRSLLQETGGYDRFIAGLEDWDLYLQLAMRTRVATCEAVVTRYRQHVGNTRNDLLAANRIRVCQKHLRLLDGRTDWPTARRARRNLYLNLAAAHWILEQPQQARRWMRAAIRTDPAVLVAPEWLRLGMSTFAPIPMMQWARKWKSTVVGRQSTVSRPTDDCD